MERTVKLNVEWHADRKGQQIALGYLIGWSPQSYPQLSIYMEGTYNMIACYSGAEGTPDYVIGAIYTDGKYSFHS